MAKRKIMFWQRLQAEGLVTGEQPFNKVIPQDKTPRFLVKAGTTVAVSHVENLEWTEYVTKKDAGFEKYERYQSDEAGKFYEFRSKGWLMLVHRRNVIHRADSCVRPAGARQT